MNRRRVRNNSMLIAFLIFLLLSLSAPFSQAQQLTVGYSSLGGEFAILPVIKEAGIFKKYGLEVTSVLITGGSRAAMALIAGDIKIVFMGAAAVVYPVARGADIVIIAGLTNLLDYSFFAAPDIKVPMDLKGKAIAISQPGTQGDFFARYLLTRWGMNPDREVVMLQVGNQADRFRALQTGRVKATMLQVPNTLIARKLGFTELARGEELNLKYQGTGVASTRSFIGTQTDLAKLFLKALVEGIHYYKKNGAEATKTIRKFLKLESDELAEESYNFYSRVIPPIPYPTREGIQTILDERGRKDPAVAKLQAESLLDIKILQEIENEGFVNKLYGEKVR